MAIISAFPVQNIHLPLGAHPPLILYVGWSVDHPIFLGQPALDPVYRLTPHRKYRLTPNPGYRLSPGAEYRLISDLEY